MRRHLCSAVALTIALVTSTARASPDVVKNQNASRAHQLAVKQPFVDDKLDAKLGGCIGSSRPTISCEAVSAQASVEQAADADSQAAAAWFQVVIGAATLVAAIVAAIFAGLAAHHTRRSADASSELLHADRAWMTFNMYKGGTIVEGSVDGKPVCHSLVLSAEFENTGRSPAINALINSRHVVARKGEPAPHFDSDFEGHDGIASIGVGKFGQGPNRALTQDESLKIMSESYVWFIYSIIKYSDIVQPHIIRYTEVCCSVERRGSKTNRDGEKEPNFIFSVVGPQNSVS